MDWQIFYSSYVQTYLERDVYDIIGVRDKIKFTQFLTAIAARTGQLLNYNNIANRLEISATTVKSWISVLETSGIVYLLQPFSNSALNRAIKTPKLYFRDTGLVCYLTRYPTDETVKNGAIAGDIFETYVVSEIVKSFLNAGIDYRMHLSFYRGRDKIRRDNGASVTESEIDVCVEWGDMIYPIGIKLSANPHIRMTDAFDIIDSIHGKKRDTGVILCMYPNPLWLDKQTVALPVSYI